MPKPRKRVKGTAVICLISRKVSLYEILYRLNDGFDQIVNQFQQLRESGVRRGAWKRFWLAIEQNIVYRIAAIIGTIVGGASTIWGLIRYFHLFGR